MNRGSPPPPEAAATLQDGFNEAPIHESGKLQQQRSARIN